jgi:catechol 2,3-dioxygenase-like lactoylglutathione lyase family enzyme
VPPLVKYVALYVPDLERAEAFYTRAFAMEFLFRESERDGEWWTLPAGKGWSEARAAGVEVHMVALRRDELVLALFAGAPARGSVHEISFGFAVDVVDRLGSNVDGVTILERSHGFVRFDDPFGFRWVAQDPGASFRSSGDIAGRWLDV